MGVASGSGCSAGFEAGAAGAGALSAAEDCFVATSPDFGVPENWLFDAPVHAVNSRAPEKNRNKNFIDSSTKKKLK